jgi:hypothetical protein
MATENCSLCDQKFNYQAKRKRFDRAEIESKLKRRDHTIKYWCFFSVAILLHFDDHMTRVASLTLWKQDAIWLFEIVWMAKEEMST